MRVISLYVVLEKFEKFVCFLQMDVQRAGIGVKIVTIVRAMPWVTSRAGGCKKEARKA
jgi:hypothetical protein